MATTVGVNSNPFTYDQRLRSVEHCLVQVNYELGTQLRNINYWIASFQGAPREVFAIDSAHLVQIEQALNSRLEALAERTNKEMMSLKEQMSLCFTQQARLLRRVEEVKNELRSLQESVRALAEKSRQGD